MRILLTILLLGVCLPVQAQAPRLRNAPPSAPFPIPGDPPPVPGDARPLLPVPPLMPPPSASVLSVGEFVKTFKAASCVTTYEVVVVHPCTGCPVKVCFALPGCPRRIVCNKTEIVFRYGLCKKPVVVTFCRDGGVLVK